MKEGVINADKVGLFDVYNMIRLFVAEQKQLLGRSINKIVGKYDQIG